MKKDDLRKLSLDILKNNLLEINLAHEKSINSPQDFSILESFLSNYNTKYENNLFSFSPNTFIVKKESKLISKLYQGIIELSPTQFEKISAALSLVLNYSNYYATKPTKDEGVDFIAERIDNDYLNTEELLFGQCKKFKTTLVTVKEIRELAGSITLFKNGEFMSKKSYITFAQKIKSHSSLKTIFITSYFYSIDSYNLSKKSGIVPIDIIDLIYLFIRGIKDKKINWSDKNLTKFYLTKFLKNINNIKVVN